jgi:hypothetical protein
MENRGIKDAWLQLPSNIRKIIELENFAEQWNVLADKKIVLNENYDWTLVFPNSQSTRETLQQAKLTNKRLTELPEKDLIKCIDTLKISTSKKNKVYTTAKIIRLLNDVEEKEDEDDFLKSFIEEGNISSIPRPEDEERRTKLEDVFINLSKMMSEKNNLNLSIHFTTESRP